MMLARRVRRVEGSPRIVLRVRPACDFGRARPQVSHGSHHIRFMAPELVLRLTTDASVTAILEEMPFFLEDSVILLLGPDETVPDAVAEVGDRFLRETVVCWRDWVNNLGIPFEWQDAVIRAAITLKLNAYEDTGAIIAAMTTSVPEAPASGRNWDYRYCWLRDGYFVVNALNRLGATRTMERYLGYVVNIAAGAGNGGNTLQPVYRISGGATLEERELPHARLPRHGTGARGQPGLPAGAARRVRLGHPCRHTRLLRPAHVPVRRRDAVPPHGVARRAGRGRVEHSGCRAVGAGSTSKRRLAEGKQFGKIVLTP